MEYYNNNNNNNDTTPAPIGPAKRSHDALKAVMLVVLFICTFLASTASLPLRNFVRSRATTAPCIGLLFSLVSSFGAGVFLATCLLDMLPDAQKSMAQAMQRVWGPSSSSQPHFPLCALFISVGFLLVLLLEHVAQCVIVWLAGRDGGGGGIGSSLFAGGGDGNRRRHQAVPVEQQHRHHRDSQREQLLLPPQVSLDNIDEDDDGGGGATPSAAVVQQQQHDDMQQQHQQVMDQHQSRHGDQNRDGLSSGGGGADRCDDDDDDLSTLRVLLLVLALNLHACCEGISIGTFTDVSVLLQIFVALLIHKSIVGFSLGIRLVQSRLCAPLIVLCCVLFAVQVLIGGFISLAIMDLLAGRTSMFMLAAIAQAIACGTFLYITTMEILPHELSASVSATTPFDTDHDDDADQHQQQQHGIVAAANQPTPETTTNLVIRSKKVAALLAGFALITLFVAIFPDADADNGNGIIGWTDH